MGREETKQTQVLFRAQGIEYNSSDVTDLCKHNAPGVCVYNVRELSA